MKTKKRLFTYLTFVLFLGFAISSCEGPVGEQGEAGLDGTNGTDGTNGINGTDGTDGANCWDTNNDGVQDDDEDVNGDGVWDSLDCDGTDGTDGTDAVVQVYRFDHPTWDMGVMVLNLEALTQEIMDTYVIQSYLGYPLDNVDDAIYYVVPGPHGNTYNVRSWMNVGTFTMNSVVWNDTTSAYSTYVNPDVASSAKILFIEPTDVTDIDGNGRNISPQQAVYNELETAGVDISNYLEVCAYYGINP